jgi:hypothetical protein
LNYLVTLHSSIPAVTQNNYVGFIDLFVITETGKELNTMKGGRGFLGAEISEADSEDRGFPLPF